MRNKCVVLYNVSTSFPAPTNYMHQMTLQFPHPKHSNKKKTITSTTSKKLFRGRADSLTVPSPPQEMFPLSSSMHNSAQSAHPVSHTFGSSGLCITHAGHLHTPPTQGQRRLLTDRSLFPRIGSFGSRTRRWRRRNQCLCRLLLRLLLSVIFVYFRECLGGIDHLYHIDPVLEGADGEGDEGKEVRVRKGDSADVAYPSTMYKFEECS